MTDEEKKVLVMLVDAGLKATGIQLGNSGGFATLQSALDKLQALEQPKPKKARRIRK